uniref:Phospholipase A1 n=1 Tax=Leersia perrieri TaxID=77586 RepID=A0A0D9V938_9ORYZ
MAFPSTTLELPCITHATPRRAHHAIVRCSSFAAAAAPARSTAIATTTSMAPVASTTTSSQRAASGSAASVASVWRKVQGDGDWAGMLSPPHPALRREAARYGEMVAACYAALDDDPSSPRHMNCRFPKRRMLRDAGAGDAGYDVTRYIYSSPSRSARASWVGYVAELALDFVDLADLGSMHDLASYVASLREEEEVLADAVPNAGGGLLAMAMGFAAAGGGIGGGALPQWQWKDAAMAVGGLVRSAGLI